MERKMTRIVWVAALAAVLVLAGCGKPVKPDANASSTVASDAAGTAGDDAASAGTVGGDTTAGGPTGELLSRRVIYFDYDSAEIRADSQAIVAAHGKYLSDNAQTRVRVEGHADERGSREYNIGLGERRAQAVRRALLLQGVSEAQLATVSYGEERPAVAGSDEDAYSQNRRAEIVYP
jgi:peptidoglycan-associated lipoprotein